MRPYDHMKRVLDIAVSATLLLVLMPVLLIVALLVRIRLGRPVVFVQVRPGRGGRSFAMLKFRTMREPQPDEIGRFTDADRLTPFGSRLRSTSLDELPSLVNVLSGSMSLVGPRPLLCEYLPLYSSDQARRHEVRPGITGWAQVNGRNAVAWEERFKMDVWYVDNRSLWLDLRILFLTFRKVLVREGITQEGSASCEPFTGSGPREDWEQPAESRRPAEGSRGPGQWTL